MQHIPNIKIDQVYDQHYTDVEIHYERLEKLADHFGRNMPAHYHDRFYQIHVILEGVVHVHLDETFYTVHGPLFFLTPPTIPHAFVSDEHARGHVLTVQQQVIWMLLGVDAGKKSKDTSVISPLCVELDTKKEEDSFLLHLFENMGQEFIKNKSRRPLALQAFLQLILIKVLRMSGSEHTQQHIRTGDAQIFRHFNHLIEDNYRSHWTLTQYAGELGVTEARLNEICRRLAGLSSKRLIMDRVMQQARRLLRFTSLPVTEIGYELGFKDPAYFARFFRRYADLTATEYRQKHLELDINN